MDAPSPEQPLGLRATGLTIRYGSTEAVADASFDIQPGTITALVGPNGAGKSTLGCALAGWRPVDAGTIESLHTDGATTQIEYRQHLVTYTTARGTFLGERRIRQSAELLEQMRPEFDRSAFNDMLAHCEIDPASRPKKLSTGQRAAVAMATGLACRLPITILDEAAVGLDAQTRAYFTERLINEAADGNRTFVISSHYISELEHLASHLVMLNRGRVAFAGAAEELTSELIAVSGRRDDVDAFTASHQVLTTQDLGVVRQATIRPTTSVIDAPADALAAGLDLVPVSLEAAVIAIGSSDAVPTNEPTSVNTVENGAPQ